MDKRSESQDFIVGEWTVTPSRDHIEANGQSATMEPLAMALLVHLARRPGQVITNDELIDQVWHGQVVSDSTVYQWIHRLRKVLRDNPHHPRYIETIRKKGYRLVASVTPLEPEFNDQDSNVEVNRVSGRKLGLAIAGGFALTLAVLAIFDTNEVQREVLPNSVAVLPLENLSPNPDDAYFAAGLHEAILSQLSKLSALNVIARTSVAQYANSDKSIVQIAEELNVETVMEGSVRYADNRVLVTAQLIDPETNVHLWSDSYNRDFADVFAIQADIAVNIANALEAEFSLAEQQSIERLPTASTAAYARYLRSIATLVLPNVQYLDEAIALDPDFGLAYATKAYAL